MDSSNFEIELFPKSAEMGAQEASAAAGMPPAGAAPPGAPSGGAPMDPAAAGAAPPGAPMDPAAAGGAPMDPAAAAAMAGGDPLGGAGAQQAPASIEEAAKMGDPIAVAILRLDKKLDVLIEAVANLLDNTGAQSPASQALASEVKSINDNLKTSSVDLLQKVASVAAYADEPNVSMGSPATRGTNGAKMLDTGLTSGTSNPAASAIGRHVRTRKNTNARA